MALDLTRILQLHANRIHRAAAAEHGLRGGEVHPHFRFGGAAVGFEMADDGPRLIAQFDAIAHFEADVLARRRGADEHFVVARRERAPCDDVQFRPHRECLRFDAAADDGGRLVRGAFRQIERHVEFAARAARFPAVAR